MARDNRRFIARGACRLAYDNLYDADRGAPSHPDRVGAKEAR